MIKIQFCVILKIKKTVPMKKMINQWLIYKATVKYNTNVGPRIEPCGLQH